MTSFGWKKTTQRISQPSKPGADATGSSVGTSSKTKRSIVEAFNDDSDGESNLDVDWLHQQTRKKSKLCLEDSIGKATRLTSEGSVLAESERYWEAITKWDEALSLLMPGMEILGSELCHTIPPENRPTRVLLREEKGATDSSNPNVALDDSPQAGDKVPDISSTTRSCEQACSSKDIKPCPDKGTLDQCARLYEMKAQVYIELREDYPAIQAAEKTVELSPLWYIGYQTLGRAQASLGELKRAVRSFSKAYRLCPWDDALRNDDLLWAHNILTQASDPSNHTCIVCKRSNSPVENANVSNCPSVMLRDP